MLDPTDVLRALVRFWCRMPCPFGPAEEPWRMD